MVFASLGAKSAVMKAQGGGGKDVERDRERVHKVDPKAALNNSCQCYFKCDFTGRL